MTWMSRRQKLCLLRLYWKKTLWLKTRLLQTLLQKPKQLQNMQGRPLVTKLPKHLLSARKVHLDARVRLRIANHRQLLPWLTKPRRCIKAPLVAGTLKWQNKSVNLRRLMPTCARFSLQSPTWPSSGCNSCKKKRSMHSTKRKQNWASLAAGRPRVNSMSQRRNKSERSNRKFWMTSIELVCLIERHLSTRLWISDKKRTLTKKKLGYSKSLVPGYRKNSIKCRSMAEMGQVGLSGSSTKTRHQGRQTWCQLIWRIASMKIESLSAASMDCKSKWVSSELRLRSIRRGQSMCVKSMLSWWQNLKTATLFLHMVARKPVPMTNCALKTRNSRPRSGATKPRWMRKTKN